MTKMIENKRLRRAYAALGSNLGDREAHMIKAIQLINECPDTIVVKSSYVYETDPVGYVEQPAFLNMVAAVDTALSPEVLITRLLEIERQLGRVRDARWGPRIIDLDLLLYEQVTMNTERLILPHPRMLERAFVLIPLLDVAGRDEIPGLDPAYDPELGGKEGVRRWINMH